MEAFALRRPVISTYVAGIPELVEPGVSGWLIPAGSIEALTSAMREALSADPADLTQMGEAGYRKVSRAHDVLHEARKLQTLFAPTAPARINRTPGAASASTANPVRHTQISA
jgi:glycosyltransferase involved in cell wall biosynthesis